MFGDQVTTDGHTSYPRARRETMGSDILHRKNTYLNTGLEQDHRGIRTPFLSHVRMQERLKPPHASVVTRDELRNYFRPRRTMGEPASLSEQRQAFRQRLDLCKHSYKQPHRETGGEVNTRDLLRKLHAFDQGMCGSGDDVAFTFLAVFHRQDVAARDIIDMRPRKGCFRGQNG
jgi:hypothetical protein